jgi:hypothetical protein
MSVSTKSIPKNPDDSNATLEAVLDAIIFYAEDGDELVSYQNKPDKVILTFEGA